MELIKETFDEDTGEYVHIIKFPIDNMDNNKAKNFVEEHYKKIATKIDQKTLYIIPDEYFVGILCKPASIKIMKKDDAYICKITIYMMSIDITVEFKKGHCINNEYIPNH